MILRFLAPADSDVEGYPFVPGQEIHVDALTARMTGHLRDGLAVLVREEPELATVGPRERAVKGRGKRRTR